MPVYAGFTPAETRAALRRREEPSYEGTFIGARRHVLHTFANSHSALMKKRATRYMRADVCPHCQGKRLKREALAVTFAGLDIGTLSQRPLDAVAQALAAAPSARLSEEKRIAAQRLTKEIVARIAALQGLGLGYLALDRSTPTLSPGELRLRIATQIRSNLFGVVYVLDEPSAGLHPADNDTLTRSIDELKRAGNTIFVVEHDMGVMRGADWLVDVGPDAGTRGGRVLYSGPPAGLCSAAGSHTARYLFAEPAATPRVVRAHGDVLALRGITLNNLHGVDADFPLRAMTAVTGVSGSGKSSLVTQALVGLVLEHLGAESSDGDGDADDEAEGAATRVTGQIVSGLTHIRRMVQVDQKPIGRTPRSNLATYTGLFDAVRQLFAATPAARSRRFGAGRFSFNVAKGALRHLRGRRFRQRRAAVHAERVCALPGLPRCALQPSHAAGAPSR